MIEGNDWGADVFVPMQAPVWVALEHETDRVLTLPMSTRDEVEEWLDYQCDDVDGRPSVITVGEYLERSRRGLVATRQINRAALEHVPDTTGREVS